MSFFCRSAEPENGITRIMLISDEGREDRAFFDVTKKKLLEMCSTQESQPFFPMEGDEIGVQLTLISRRGSNGQHGTS